jgi:hypothetical protein
VLRGRLRRFADGRESFSPGTKEAPRDGTADAAITEES